MSTGKKPQTEIDVEQVIRGYLPQIAHMSLGTSSNGKPWVCEVHYAYDDELNIYFCSSMDSRHSREIRENPQVAGTIVTQHFMNQKVRGVYYEGTAQQLDDIETDDHGVKTYEKRFGFGPQVVEAARKDGRARFYKITVTDFYVADGYQNDPPHKFHLPWKK